MYAPSTDNYKIADNVGAGNGADFRYQGGRTVLIGEATWGGGNVKLQYKTINGTYIDVTGATLSANGMTAMFELPAGVYRSVVTTATAVHAWIMGTRN